MRRLIATYALVLSSAAHSEPPFVETETAKWLPGFECRGGKYGLRLPSTYLELTSLASMLEDRVEMVEREGDYTVTRRTLSFPGLVVGVAVPSDDPDRYLVSGVNITEGSWKSLSPFFPGQTIGQVKTLLGKAAAADPDLKASYGTETSGVSFKVRNGHVLEVVYQCYTG